MQEPFHDLSLPIPGTYTHCHWGSRGFECMLPTSPSFPPFLSLSGRKEMAKSHHRTEKEPTDPKDPPTTGKSGTLSRGLCTVINLVSQVRDMFSGPPTIIQDCLDAFFDPSELKGRLTSSIHIAPTILLSAQTNLVHNLFSCSLWHKFHHIFVQCRRQPVLLYSVQKVSTLFIPLPPCT